MNAAQNQSPANAQQQTAQSPSPVMQPTKAGQAGNSGQESQGNARWSDPLVLLNFALFVAVLIQAGIYWKQLIENRNLVRQNGEIVTAMQGQLKAIETQAGFMETQTRAALEAVEMAKGQLVAMQSQERAQYRQLEAMENQLVVMRDNLKETRNLFYMGNRAYLAIDGVEIHDFEAGKRPTVLLKVINAGATPAWKLRMHSKVDFSTQSLDYLGANDQVRTQDISPILPAKTDRVVTIEAPKGTAPLTPKQVIGVTQGFVRLFVRGAIIFEDISGEDQTLAFCLEYRKGVFGDCKRENKQPEPDNPN